MKFDKKKQKILWPIFNFPKVYPNLKDGIPSTSLSRNNSQKMKQMSSKNSPKKVLSNI